jgi:two-component system chemotaxis response regulator CheB
VDKKSVLVVDDSAFMRKLISDMINSSDDFYVCGTASNGAIGLQKIPLLNPDVITLDIHMPVKDGLDALKVIMKDFPRPVIMLSAYTKAGAQTTIMALELGAFDFIAKPSGEISLDITIIKEELLEKLRSAIKADLANLMRSEHPDAKSAAPRREKKERKSHRVISIAASTGGPQSLIWLLPGLPEDIPASFLVVQHMPKGFTSQFAQRLDKVCKINVKEAENGDILGDGWVFIAPGDYHVTLERMEHNGEERIIRLNQDPPVWGVRPSADVLFSSVADCCGKNAMGIILTGMGRDGALGIKKIKDAGGITLVQTPETALIGGMPKAAINTGAVDHVIPFEDIGDFILKKLKEKSD